MYPCTMCGLPLDGPVCPRCGQTHSAPGRPLNQQPALPGRQPTPWDEAPRGPAIMAPTSAGSAPPPAPPAPAPVPHTKGPGTAIAAAAISLVVLIALVTLGWSYFFSGEDASTTVVPTPTTAPATLTPPPSPTVESVPTPDPTSSPPRETLSPPADPTQDTPTASTPEPVQEADVTVNVQEVAREELEVRRAESLAFIALDGRWVAVLSTKKSGTEDPEQTAKNGSHVFYADDILALHDDLAGYFWDEARVLLVKTSDFGKQPKSGDVFWRTIADAGFTSEEDVTAWCGKHYSGTPKEIENSCLAREMLPPTTS